MELKRYWSDLETDNLLLLVPRRVGKTSAMRRMQSSSAQQGYSVVFVDVSDAADEIAFVRRLYQAVLETDGGTGLWNRLKDSWLGNAVSRVKKVGGGGFSVEFNQNTTVSRDANGCTRDTLSQVLGAAMSDVRERNEKLHYLLDVLRSDGYLVEHEGRWQFRFPLLRDYWRKRVAP